MAQHTNTRKTPTKRKPTPRGSADGATRPATRSMRKVPAEQQDSQQSAPAAGTTAPAARIKKNNPTRSMRLVDPNESTRAAKTDTRRSVKTKGTSAGKAGAPAKGKRLRRAIAIVVALALAAGALALLNVYCSIDNNRLKLCEQWRSTVRQACLDTNLDEQWVDALLALMAVESGGKTDVQSVLGVEGDIMQAAEGAYGEIVKNGSRKYGAKAETPEASIYAGVLEFKQNLKLWKKYLNGVGVSETGEIQLIVQGYNFGADGWYNWCKKNKIKTYSVEKAQEYSDTMMPDDAKGTPTHGEKWLNFYHMIHG